MSNEEIKSILAALEAEAAAPPPPPPGWDCWKEPKDPSPVDRFVTDLIRKRRPPRIDPDGQYPFSCPYHYVRTELAKIRWRVDRTAEAITCLVQQRAEVRDRHVRAVKTLRAALDAVSAVVADLELPEGSLSFPNDDNHSIIGGFGDQDELASYIGLAHYALSNAVCHADLLRHTLTTKPADFHRRAYLAHIGKIYKLMTGSRPAAGDGPFPEFAAHAYAFLWPDREAGDFNKLIRSTDFSFLEIFLGD